MNDNSGLPIFVAGLGVGVALTLILTNDGEAWKKGTRTMSDVKNKVKDKIDDAADTTKKVVDKVVDKSKDAAHQAGEHLERGGKRLQQV